MYTFVEEKEVLFKYELVELNPERIYEHFMLEDDEICFVMDKNQVYGIITIGDMCRYYAQDKEKLNINRKYRSISAVDYEAAEKVFQKFPTVHEVPIVVDNRLLGVVKKEQHDNKSWIRQMLKREHDGEERWTANEFDRILKQLKGKVYLYDLWVSDIVDGLSESDKEALEKKSEYPWGTSGLRMMSEEEKRAFAGEDYSADAFEEFCLDFDRNTITLKNGIGKINDLSSRNFNFCGGYRRVVNANEEAPRRIWMLGPCTVLGAYAEDKKTIESYLQKILTENGYDNYCVVNCGLFGPDYVIGRIATEKIAPEDIVVILHNVGNYAEKQRGKEILSEIYLKLEKPIDNVFNAFAHCNHVVNQKIAERLFKDIKESLTRDTGEVSERTAVQDYWIPWNVVKYYKDYCNKYHLVKNETLRCGAIVMNCNPFTKGHRYLIEQALRQVDLLYLFVVEEDESAFKFEDRIEMVRRGTADLDNVRVLPSGKYIISKETFAQYFEKDNVDQIEDIDYDVRIFGEVVARELGIDVRFVGNEPFDKVTRRYNETLKSILPQYDIEVIEIPRVTVGGSAISASAVRKALEAGDKDLVESMVPESTLGYLMKGKSAFL